MRSIVTTVVVVLMMAAAAFADISVTSPANGSTVTSPAHFVASASSGYPITAIRIYVDNNPVYTTNSAYLDTQISMSPGNHYVVVQAWDSSGAVFRSPMQLTVSGSTGGVVIHSPGNGAAVSSPVPISASGYSSRPISAMRVYVDNADAYTTSGGTINTTIPMSPGPHKLSVQAWDSSGAVFVTPLNLTVAGTTPSISVASPSNGATVSSPVTFNATAVSPHPVTAMRVYVDSASAYATSGGTINTGIAMSPGWHNVVVQAWDSTGAVFKTAMNINVAPPVKVPSYATTLSNIDQMGGWESCTVCAGEAGSGPVASYGMHQGISTPSLDGQAARFTISGTTPYANALWWKQLGANSKPTQFVYDLYFYVDSPQYAQALEFDVNQSVGGYKYIFGTQCAPRGSGQWDVWDGTAQAWRPTGIACPAPSPNTWHHLVQHFQRDSNGHVTYVSITLDGVTSYINRTYGSLPSYVNEINVAFQMDGDYAQHSYNTWLDKVTLSYW